MKRWGLRLMAAGLMLGLIGCGGAKKELHLYTWADYVKPELVERFEKENNCRVIIDTFDSNEAMYAKIKAGAAGYDLLIPSSYMVKVMNDQKMLQKLDHALLPNVKNLDADYLKMTPDAAMEHSVPYMFSATCIAYLKSKVPDFVPTWKAFDRADIKGRATLLNDMRETLGAALKLLGYSLNTKSEKELNEAKAIVVGWKKNIAKFENEQYKTGIASAEFSLVHGYSGDIVQVMEENEDIGFAIPAEGTSLTCDDLVIPVGAKEVALAHAYINFMHDPDVAAENTEFNGYLCPNTAAYPKMTEEVRGNPAIFMDPMIRAKSEVIQDVGEALPLYTKIWDEVKAAQ